MDQRQGGSPFDESSRSPASPRTPTTEEARRQRQSPSTHPYRERSPFHDRRHLTPPPHTSPNRGRYLTNSSSTSPTLAALVPSRRSRDRDQDSYLASSSHDEASLSDSWPHASNHFTASSSTYSAHLSHPLGRLVVFDEGTFDRPLYKEFGGGEYGEPYEQRKRPSPSREGSYNLNGPARQALEYEAGEHAGRESIPREGTEHVPRDNGSLTHPHRSGPWKSSGQAFEEGDRWSMTVPGAKMSTASTVSPSSIASQYPYSSSYPRPSYLDSNPNAHQSGSQPSPMVAPVDNHNRRHNDRLESLNRSIMDGHPRAPQYNGSQYQPPHHQPPRSQSFSQEPRSRTSPSPSRYPIAQTSSAGTSTNRDSGPHHSYGYPAQRPPIDPQAGEAAGRPFPSSTNPPPSNPPHSNHSSGPLPSSAPSPSSSAPPPRSHPPQPIRLPNLPRRQAQDDANNHEAEPDSGSSSRSSSRTRWEPPSPRNYGSMHRKFGTDMPTTVDLRSAIEICDTLCQFALHYASQDPREMFYDSSNEDDQDPIHRANLQMIRNLNSTMLTGLQPSSRGLDGETPMEGSGSGSDAKQPRMPTTMDEGEDDSDDEEIRFGKGLPPDELVHELAKAATSIFQMSVRIKAWVGMTPEQRELDEEINIIRGKRCLFMDGSTAMPFPSLDVYSQYGSKLYSQDGLKGMYNRRFNDPTAMSISQGFRRPGDIGSGMGMQLEHERDYSQNSTPYGSYRSTTSSHADALSDMRGRSGVRIPGLDEKDLSHQKYRKRAKRLHPPGRCQSCHTSDTPEWRRGPDGAGTLCNACGLQYAKLLKRQQQQKLQPLQDGQADKAEDEGSKVRTAQPLNFQILKNPTPAAATEPGATAPTG